MLWSELEGRRVAILGTGREGVALGDRLRGASAAASVIAADSLDGESAAAWRARFGDEIPLLIEPDATALAAQAEVAIASPGIPPHAPLYRAAVEAALALTTATDLWLGDNASRTTAVTGSKGKSTTASLIDALQREHGVDSALGGNIGVPLLSLPRADRYVAELSSYQSSSVTVSPEIVVLTSLFPEHLDWHGDVDAYYAAKLNLAAHGARHVIVNATDPRLGQALARLAPELAVERVGAPDARWRLDDDGATVLREGVPLVAGRELHLRGRHNLLNVTLALAAVEAVGVELDPDLVRAALAGFAPLEHRLESFVDSSGLSFVDDSLSTSPYATIAALEAVGDDDTVLLVGGQDRGVDFAPLAEYLAEHPVAAVIGMPESGARILAALAEADVLTVPVDDMRAAVLIARRLAPPGGTVLLSPASPSYGRYRDFADRAADFRRHIAQSAP